MVEKQILKLFCEDKDLFTKYYKYVNINYIKINYSNIYKLYNVINIYYNTYTDKDNIIILNRTKKQINNYSYEVLHNYYIRRKFQVF